MACVLMGFFFAWVFSLSGDHRTNQFVRITVAPSDVYSTIGNRSSYVWIETAERDYRVESAFWNRTPYSRDQFETILRSSESLTLWVNDTSLAVPAVRGIESARVRFGPEIGVAVERENQQWGLALVLFFLFQGV